MKVEQTQASFRFVLKPGPQEGEYVKYLSDPSSVIDWKHVFEVAITLADKETAEKMLCPICRESAFEMVAPRITKCGHIFCYSCLLQYLDYIDVDKQQYAWKKCPICSESVYHRDIRRAGLQLGASLDVEDEDVAVVDPQTVEFKLMVRNKSNVIVKDLEFATNNKVLNTRLPSVHDESYWPSRVRICDADHLENSIKADVATLHKDLKFRLSCSEIEVIPVLMKAIEWEEN